MSVVRALLLTPSRGRGGGIERYAETLEWAFASEGVKCQRLDLSQAGLSAHARLVAQARTALHESGEPTRIVAVHRSLVPAARLLARHPAASGISVVCHGNDVWASRLRPRLHVENYLMQQPGVRVMTVSSFTSGALFRRCPTAVLPPGLSQQWFSTLVEASARPRQARPPVRLVTAFRLPDWQQKGLPELLQAVAALGRDDIRVTVCGTGTVPPDLRQFVSLYPRCDLQPGLDDSALAGELAGADLFVLATRTRFGRRPSGEGFGMVLMEAQLAGTAVVGPAYGGSHDAYIEGLTGLTPTDESAAAMAVVLDRLLGDPDRLAQLSRRAAEWSRQAFSPASYASLAVARLL